jgi:hypothetical protein
MRRLLCVLWLASCAPKADKLPTYETDLLHIASGFAAKEACSCVFVSGRSIDECKAFVKVSPAVATFRVDDEERRVVAHALGGARVVAKFVDDRTGCVLD